MRLIPPSIHGALSPSKNSDEFFISSIFALLNSSEIGEFLMNSYCRQVLTNVSEIEGYCLLNTDYGMCKDRYVYVLKPDQSFKRTLNDRYNPAMKPDPYPKECPRSVSSRCIGCSHFSWCDPDDDAERGGMNG